MTTDMGLAPASFPLPHRSTAAAELLPQDDELPSLSDKRVSLSDQQISQAVLAATSLAATSPPDLAAFIARLNDLRVEKQLSYDRLGRRCQRRPELRLSRSGIYKMLTSMRLPNQQQLVSYLSLCDVSSHEHTLWIGLYQQVKRALDARLVMQPATPVAIAAPPAKPKQRETTQREPVDWRGPRIPPLHRRGMLPHATYTFTGSVLLASLAAIVLSAAGVPPEFIIVPLTGVAAGVAAWAWAWATPLPREHRATYPIVADYFRSDEPVTPPVIG